MKRLIEEAKARGPMSSAELRAQQISFVYGQLMDAAPHITKAQIGAEFDRMEGKTDD